MKLKDQFCVQGLSTQGFCFQGLSAQGFCVQGLSVQGFCGQGFCNLHTGILRTGIKRIGFKGTVSRNFLLLVFFINQFPPSPRVSH